MDLSNKTVLVTGASRGIGRAIVTAFLAKGANVIGVSKSEVENTSVHPGRYFHISVDISDNEAASETLSRIPADFQNISILVNNAGIKVETDFETATVANWDTTLNTNLRSAYFITQALTPMLAKSGRGRVINIASQSGVAHVSSSIEYGLSKAGLIYLTKSLARVLAKKNITVNAISPGRTHSDMTGYAGDPKKLARTLEKIPLHTINTPEEIAEYVLFLASDTAHNMTGQIIGVDGGEANF